MKKSVYSTFLIAALAAVTLQSAAPAQFEPVPAKPSQEESRPPVPPGVPTNPYNVHLPTEGEVRLGRESAAQVEKYYKIISSGPYHERLQRVSKEVVAAIQRDDIVAEYRRIYNLPRRDDHARRVPFEFSFKVVDTSKELNAFSLAGGPVYVTTALMDYATSDHELAAVLAHECAHVVFHHVEQLVRKQKKAQAKQLWGLLATVIAGAAGGGAAASAATNVLLGAQLVDIATLNGYGQELEKEADRMGVRALTSTQYHPLGMMTFMMKLAREEQLRDNPSLRAGIFQTHPYSNERAETIRKEVERLGYRADSGTQRLISGAFRVTSTPQRVDGKDIVELRLNGKTLFTVAAGEGEMSVRERAEKMARQIEALFAENLTYNDVRQSADKTVVLLKGIPVIRAYPEDALLMGSQVAAAEKAYKQIMRALLSEQLNKPY